MKRQHVIQGPEGAAIRVQLDGMISSLRAFDRPAAEAGDDTVTRLLSHLIGAAREASAIERRSLPEPPVVHRKGVRLGKL